jgi:pimeloyl-ACP methyl ester carboxylesterase
VALSLPGFGSARPAGFGATMDEYAGWLAAQLERLGAPVDLVGHDWGGGSGWHDFARIWQAPQAGEDFRDQQLAAPAPGLVIIPSEDPFLRRFPGGAAADAVLASVQRPVPGS